MRIVDRDRQIPILIHTCVLLNMGPVQGIRLNSILGTAYEIYYGIDNRTKLGSLIGG